MFNKHINVIRQDWVAAGYLEVIMYNSGRLVDTPVD